MVAINFTGWWTGKETKEEQKKEVFRKIRCGEKYSTIRVPRKDGRIHCKVGDDLQLYWGMGSVRESGLFFRCPISGHLWGWFECLIT